MMMHRDFARNEGLNLKKAKYLLDRIDKRSQYKFIQNIILHNDYSEEHKSKKAISTIKTSILTNSRFKADEFIIEVGI